MHTKVFDFSKSPIPVLNRNSPHNYVIMSSLLSNTSNDLFAPFSVSGVGSNSGGPESFTAQKSRSMATSSSSASYIEDNQIKIAENQSSRTSSHDIVYQTRRLKSKKRTSSNVQTLNPTFNNAHQQQAPIFTIQHISSAINNEHLLNDFLDPAPVNLTDQQSINATYQHQTNDQFSLNTVSNQTTFMFNQPSNGNDDFIEVNSFDMNNNQLEQETIIDNSDELIINSKELPVVVHDNCVENTLLKEHNYNENNLNYFELSLNLDKSSLVSSFDLNQLTDWNSDTFSLNKNCLVVLDECSTDENSKITLKCVECGTVFSSIDLLKEHKESNYDCRHLTNMTCRIQKTHELNVAYSLRENDLLNDDDGSSDDSSSDCAYLDDMEDFDLNGAENEHLTIDDQNEHELDSRTNGYFPELKYGHKARVKIKKNVEKVSKKSKNLQMKICKLKNSKNSETTTTDNEDQNEDDNQEIIRPRRKYNKNKNFGNASLLCESN